MITHDKTIERKDQDHLKQNTRDHTQKIMLNCYKN